MISTAVVEPDDTLRRMLAESLDSNEDFQVSFEANSAESALVQLTFHRVDALLVDLDLPGMSGTEFITEVRTAFPRMIILVNTDLEDRNTVLTALRRGASGYILKGINALDIAQSIRDAKKGGWPISPAIARWITEYFMEQSRFNDFRTLELTRREIQILNQLAAGGLYKEIADELKISHHTVHAHIRKIYSKLQASGRKEAIKRARMLGYISPNRQAVP